MPISLIVNWGVEQAKLGVFFQTKSEYLCNQVLYRLKFLQVTKIDNVPVFSRAMLWSLELTSIISELLALEPCYAIIASILRNIKVRFLFIWGNDN